MICFLFIKFQFPKLTKICSVKIPIFHHLNLEWTCWKGRVWIWENYIQFNEIFQFYPDSFSIIFSLNSCISRNPNYDCIFIGKSKPTIPFWRAYYNLMKDYKFQYNFMPRWFIVSKSVVRHYRRRWRLQTGTLAIALMLSLLPWWQTTVLCLSSLHRHIYPKLWGDPSTSPVSTGTQTHARASRREHLVTDASRAFTALHDFP